MMHPLPDSWNFNGNLEKPTFSPSFKHSWNNNKICHYIVTDGLINYCGDCTHSMANQIISIPNLPEGFDF
jgi:hypothetical protein